MKKALLLTALIALFKISFAQEPKEINVLFLGNSYTYVNDLPHLISELTKETDNSIEYESVCPGGCTLFQHVDSNVSMGKIKEGKWDYVVLQEQSQLPSIDYYRHNAMRPSYQTLYDSIMFYNPEATVVGYMTWGRRYGGQQCVNFGEGLYCSADFADFNHMQDTMTVAYCENAYYTDSWTAPVGEAWREAMTEDPNIVLFSSDNSHPSYEGSYLAACVFYAVFYQESPVGRPFGDLTEETATMLQNVAHRVVFDNLETWNINFPTSIQKSEASENNIDVISNPYDDTIKIINKNNVKAKVSIINISGVTISEQEINGDTELTINNAKGIYIVRITENNNRQYSEKVVKIK